MIKIFYQKLFQGNFIEFLVLSDRIQFEFLECIQEELKWDLNLLKTILSQVTPLRTTLDLLLKYLQLLKLEICSMVTN